MMFDIAYNNRKSKTLKFFAMVIFHLKNEEEEEDGDDDDYDDDDNHDDDDEQKWEIDPNFPIFSR